MKQYKKIVLIIGLICVSQLSAYTYIIDNQTKSGQKVFLGYVLCKEDRVKVPVGNTVEVNGYGCCLREVISSPDFESGPAFQRYGHWTGFVCGSYKITLVDDEATNTVRISVE